MAEEEEGGGLIVIFLLVFLGVFANTFGFSIVMPLLEAAFDGGEGS